MTTVKWPGREYTLALDQELAREIAKASLTLTFSCDVREFVIQKKNKKLEKIVLLAPGEQYRAFFFFYKIPPQHDYPLPRGALKFRSSKLSADIIPV
jgi:hypothetical protein